mmetsp:Transcript_61592/g.163099  ORF Transcript_61592/g.163099 Transcript_61592/m.163099 type:complete len:244 (+) Transcript_61592:329-1060(+)
MEVLQHALGDATGQWGPCTALVRPLDNRAHTQSVARHQRRTARSRRARLGSAGSRAHGTSGLQRQVDGPEEGRQVVAQRDPAHRHKGVAHQVDKRPEAEARRPRLDQVLLDLGGPPLEAGDGTVDLDERGAEEDGRDRGPEARLAHERLHERVLEAESGDDLGDHLEPVVQRGPKIKQTDEAARDRARHVAAVGRRRDALAGDVGQRKDAARRDGLGDDGVCRERCRVGGAEPREGELDSASA